MEEEQECGDEAQEGEEETRVDIHRKAPDKHRHQLEMEYLTSLIHEKEALLYKSLHAPKTDKGILSKTESSREELLSKLRSLKGKKEKRMNRKQIIDAELKGLSQQLQKKRETCTKLQANLRYKDEQRTNDAIKRLEKHLSTQQLKLSEEKKLVSEIDCLRRSKKTISEYLCAKQDMDQLRQNQSKLRDERDTLIRETHSIKANENDFKRCLDDIKTENKEDDSEKEDQAHDQETLKKEIDSLYESRREINGAYKQEMVNYREEQKKIERNVTKIKAEEKRDEIRISKMSVDRRRPKTRQEVEPYKVEKKLCACLIKYLEPYKAQSLTGLEEDKPTVQGRYIEVPKSELSRAEESQDGSFVMKKDNENLDGMFAVSSRRMSRKGSRKGRKSKDSCQIMVLHPHVFEQFLKLNLEPPSTFADVSGILKQLKEKKEFYEKSGNTTDQRSLSLAENPALDTLNEASVGLIGEEFEPDNDSGVGKDTCGIIRDKEEHDKDLSLNNMDQISEVFDETQGLESLDIDAESVESMGIDHTSGISRTNEDSPEGQGEQHGAEDREIERSNEQITSSNEKPTIEEKEIVEENEKGKEKEIQVIAEKKQLSAKEEEFARNQENSLEIMKDSCVKHSTVITDTLEKGLDSLGMKESSKEIEV